MALRIYTVTWRDLERETKGQYIRETRVLTRDTESADRHVRTITARGLPIIILSTVLEPPKPITHCSHCGQSLPKG